MVTDPPGWESHAGMGTVKSGLELGAAMIYIYVYIHRYRMESLVSAEKEEMDGYKDLDMI